jgi:hypothetical protein
MLGFDLIQEPRAIREAKEEGRQEGRRDEATKCLDIFSHSVTAWSG